MSVRGCENVTLYRRITLSSDMLKIARLANGS
jgi:hypothetical protein